jgi:hypothetical protein
VNIAGTKRTSFQVTELVEHEEGSAERFFSAVSQRVSKRPIWLGEAALA